MAQANNNEWQYLRLRSGRLLLRPRPPPIVAPAVVAPPLPGPLPPANPPPAALLALPVAIRMQIFRYLFQGLPMMNVENLSRPPDLQMIFQLGNAALYDEAEEAFLSVCRFAVWVTTGIEQAYHLNRYVDHGQNPAVPGLVPPAQRWGTMQQIRQRVARARVLSASLRSQSWGRNSYYRVSVFTFPRTLLRGKTTALCTPPPSMSTQNLHTLGNVDGGVRAYSPGTHASRGFRTPLHS